MLSSPKLQIEFNLAGPHCLKTPLTDQQTSQRVGDAYYFRFRVKNNGRSQARLCECVIEKLWQKERNEWVLDKTFQPMNLKWSNSKSTDEFLHINPKMPGWFCDLVHITNVVEKEKLWIDYKQPIPHSQRSLLDQGTEYKIAVSVYCENAKEVKKTFEIYWSGVWRDECEHMFKEVQLKMY